MKLECCYPDCPKEADFLIKENTRIDDSNYTHSCREHLGEMMGWTEGFPECHEWTVIDLNRELIHLSDCAVHNAPALPTGKCNCGAIEQTNDYLHIVSGIEK